VHDRLNGTTELVSLSTGGAQASTGAGGPSISSDGRFVAFSSSASNLVTGDTNATVDVFVRDRQLGTTERVSLTADGAQATFGGVRSSISSDGRHVAFTSGSTDLVAGDTNNETDIFVRDRVGTPYFTSLCDPGVAGVIPCPCSNPPASSGHGCENSAATGGAILTASGASLLSTDGLVFTTSGELPTATSLVFQGNALAANGVVFGQGVRCSTGTNLVLYVKRASGGSITAPDLGGGDPTVSSRSAALGDPIQAGMSRWYGVAYRDPNVLGGCSPSSPWNSTQTGQVVWWW